MNPKTLPETDNLENEYAEAVFETEATPVSKGRHHKIAQPRFTQDRRDESQDKPKEYPVNDRSGINPRAVIDRECGDYRHWSPSSQTFAPADVLLQYLGYGWTIESPTFVQSFCCLGSRSVEVYYFLLARDAERVWLPVLANPAVRRLIHKSDAILVRLGADAVANHPTREEELAIKQATLPFAERKSTVKGPFVAAPQPAAHIS